MMTDFNKFLFLAIKNPNTIFKYLHINLNDRLHILDVIKKMFLQLFNIQIHFNQ